MTVAVPEIVGDPTAVTAASPVGIATADVEILGDPTAVVLITPAGVAVAPACTVAAP